MVGLVPSATTCKPCATAAASSADAGDAEDVESSAGACPHVSAYGMEGCLQEAPLSCSSSSGSQEAVALRFLRVAPKSVWCRTEDW
jgi:hypothetical protein